MRHRDFRLLWAGQTVSRVGTEVSVLALPLIAIQILHATTFEVGSLTAVETLPFLLVGLPAGAWVDRMRRRRVLIVADVGRLIALGSIPIASAFASITLAHLFVVAFVTGVFTVFFDVAYQSYLPELVDREQLVDGNAKLAASESTAHVVGPGIGGALISWVGASTAVVADALSYAVSFVCLIAIRTPAEVPDRGENPTSLVTDIREGLRFVWHENRIRAVAFCTATANLFSGVMMAVVLLFMTRVLGFSGGKIGFVFAVSGLGAVVGAVIAPWLARRFGVGRAILLSIALGGVGPFLIAAATGSLAPALIALGFGIAGGAGVALQHQPGQRAPGDLSSPAPRPHERERALPRVGHAPARRVPRRRARLDHRHPPDAVGRRRRAGPRVPLAAAVADPLDARNAGARRRRHSLCACLTR